MAAVWNPYIGKYVDDVTHSVVDAPSSANNNKTPATPAANSNANVATYNPASSVNNTVNTANSTAAPAKTTLAADPTGSAGGPAKRATGTVAPTQSTVADSKTPTTQTTTPAGTPTVVYRNGQPINAYIVNGQTVDGNGNRFPFQDGDIVNTQGGQYIWYGGGATKYTPQAEYSSAFTIGGETPYLEQMYADYPMQDYIQQYLDAAEAKNEAKLQALQAQMDASEKGAAQQLQFWQDQYNDIKEQLLAANKAATEKSVLELQAQLENGLGTYDQQRAQAAITQARAANNAALRNTAAGDMGGIGQKQYSAEQNAYDQNLMSIQLEQINFQNQINQQIAQLEAEGRYQEADLLAEWGQQKINTMQDQYDWYWEMRYKNAYDLDALNRTLEAEQYERTQAADELAYNRAMQRLQLGIFSAEDAEALGIPAEDAQRVADYYQQMAALDLQAAQADLDATIAKMNGTGGSGSGGGGRTYRTSGGGGGGEDEAANPDLSLFERLYMSGYEPDSYEAYKAMIDAGYGSAQWRLNNMLEYYSDYFNQQEAAKKEASGAGKGVVGNALDAVKGALGNTVYVQGYGNMPKTLLQQMIQNNKVVATVGDDGTIVYFFRGANGSGAGGGGNNSALAQ